MKYFDENICKLDFCSGVRFSSRVHMNGYEDENSYGENGDSDEEELRKRVSNKRRPSGMLNLSNKDTEALRYLYY